MEIEQNIALNIENQKNQNEFLNSTLWKTINNGIDIGLRYLLPDFVEDEIIDLKDNLINYGLKDGVKKSIESVIETGKQALGIVTGNFENIGQIENTLKNGGVIDKISDVFDVVIDKVEETGKINSTVSNVLKKGKTSILSSVEKNIEATLAKQVSGTESIQNYIESWKMYYSQKDFSGMEIEFAKMEKELEELIPIENTLKAARYVENIHNLIRNNGQNFELTEEELELASKLS